MANEKLNPVETKEFINSLESSLAVISVRTDEIIEIRFKKDEYEVDVSDQLEIEKIFLKLTNDGKISYHVLVIPGLYGGITKEAREMEMFESKAFKNQRSIAIVVRSLSARLLGTLYFSLKKHKPNYPHKLFDSENKALQWIQQKQ